jgi:hypothetical protein
MPPPLPPSDHRRVQSPSPVPFSSVPVSTHSSLRIRIHQSRLSLANF